MLKLEDLLKKITELKLQPELQNYLFTLIDTAYILGKAEQSAEDFKLVSKK